MTTVVCPTVLADNLHTYREQVQRILPFAKRVQIDLTDGKFAPSPTIALDRLWLPHEFEADLHLMYHHPDEHLKELLKLRPHMVIIHAEADIDHMRLAAELHKEDILVGLAVLQKTTIESVEPVINSFDHLLIFSGYLGHFGGEADLELLSKVKEAREHHPDIEIGWDGGVTVKNATELVHGGVDVLNAGGFIQRSSNPNQAYLQLVGAAHAKA